MNKIVELTPLRIFRIVAFALFIVVWIMINIKVVEAESVSYFVWCRNPDSRVHLSTEGVLVFLNCKPPGAEPTSRNRGPNVILGGRPSDPPANLEHVTVRCNGAGVTPISRGGGRWTCSDDSDPVSIRRANGAELPDYNLSAVVDTGSTDGLDASDVFGTSREELQNCSGADCVNNNPITKMAILVINALSALIGVIAVAVIVVAGIEYSSSGGVPQKAAQAKKRIINAVIALAAYFFLFAVLQWLIPGGLFS